MSPQENLCKARGCERCCWNTFFGMSIENFRLFNDALESRGVKSTLQTFETFKKLQGFVTTSPGDTVVIYCLDHNQPADVIVQIFRKCTFLVDGDCGLMRDPARPLGCDTLPFQGAACEKIFSGGSSFIPSVIIE